MKQLFDAIKAGETATVLALLDAQPELVNAKDDAGLSAFMTAKYNRKDDIAQLLLDRGATLDIFAAAMSGNDERLREILASLPASVSEFSQDGWTPLHLAAFFGQEACARTLIAAGAPVNERGKNAMQNMPLHAAAAGRKVDVVIALLEGGAAVNARQHGGWTALHAAAQNGDVSIGHVLIGGGADLTARADNHQTDLRRRMRRTAIVARSPSPAGSGAVIW